MSDSHPSESIKGHYYSGTDSRRQQATLRLVGGNLVLERDGSQETLKPGDVRLSPRLGSSPRYLYLPEGAVFETADNPGVDQLARALRTGVGWRMLHRLESHLGLILVAAIVTVAAVTLSFTHGIPWTARVVAQAVPESVAVQLGESALDTLDRFVLSPSELSENERQRLQRVFEPYLADRTKLNLNVEFRDAGRIGANAMALPDGTLIMTDALVELAERDEELVAVLAHEIGHVVHRHGLERVVQNSLVAWIMVLVTGDLSALGDGSGVGPLVLVNMAYSREAEREADEYALALMRDEGLDPIHFANIMRLLTQAHGDHSPAEDTAREDSQETDWKHRIQGFLASHPHPDERIRQFEEASRQESTP